MITIKEEFYNHAKTKLAHRRGGSDALLLWHQMKAHCSQRGSGFVPTEAIEDFPLRVENPQRALEALRDCGEVQEDGTRGPGLIEEVAHGWHLHDYDDHAMTATELEDRKQADRDRKQLQRDRAKARVLLTESGTPRQEAERLVRDMSRDSVCDILRDMSRDMSRDVTPRADTRVRPPTRDPSPAQPSPTQPFAAAAREAIDQPEDDPGEPTDSQVRSVVPEPGAVAAPVAGFGAARLHLELPAIEPKLSEAPGAIQRPRNLEEALKLPIGDRARFVEAEPHIAEWLQPDKWPGVQAFAREVSEALNMTQTPLGAYKRDSGVRAIVALYAQFSKEQLEQAITAMASDEWLKSKRGGLSILTPEVVRRLLQGPAKPRRPQRQPDNGGGYSVADAYAAQQKAHA